MEKVEACDFYATCPAGDLETFGFSDSSCYLSGYGLVDPP
jgi:hypothetical protein